MNKKLENIIKQAIDIHLHIGPEIIPRKYTVNKLTSEEEGKISGCVLKNHFYPTTALIQSTKANGLELYGSVVLNNFVGGLNPEAVYGASIISDKPIIVWFPTMHARQFLDNSKYEIPPEWVNKKGFQTRLSQDIQGISTLDDSELSRKAISVLDSIKETNSILATGHISWQESEQLIYKAMEMSINKIIITHPIYQRINMPLIVQKKLATLGCYIEHCYSMYTIDNIDIAQIISQIQEVGVNHVILSSDVGQKFSMPPSQALYEFAEKLIEEGLEYKDIKIMMVQNTRKLLSNIGE